MASTDKVKVVETTKEYELLVADLVPSSGEDERTWYNQTAGMLLWITLPKYHLRQELPARPVGLAMDLEQL